MHSAIKKLLLLFFVFGFVMAASAQTFPPVPPPPPRPPVNDTVDYGDELPPSEPAPKPLGDEVFQFAEQMPSFPGGDSAWTAYLKQTIVYPKAEKDSSIAGTAYVGFVVETDGSISGVTLKKGVPNGPGLNQEALRAIANSPKWNPGIMDGRPVRVAMIMPVRFVVP
jgi:TonB family protein